MREGIDRREAIGGRRGGMSPGGTIGGRVAIGGRRGGTSRAGRRDAPTVATGSECLMYKYNRF